MFGKNGIATENIEYVLRHYEKMLQDKDLGLSGYMSALKGAHSELKHIRQIVNTNIAFFTGCDTLMNAWVEYCESHMKSPNDATKYEFLEWLLESPSIVVCECPPHIKCAMQGKLCGRKTCNYTNDCPFKKKTKLEETVRDEEES